VIIDEVPNDAPGDDCPSHGPYGGEDCPKCGTTRPRYKRAGLKKHATRRTRG
jgi:hypothetical protein